MPDKTTSVEKAAQVLIVTDDRDTRRSLAALFADPLFRASHIGDAFAIQAMLTYRHFDLLMIDTRLEDRDCLALCRLIRAISNVAIVLVVESHEDTIVIAGLDAGADAYVLRTERPQEMLTRLRSVLRRAMGTCIEREDATPMRFAGWHLHPGNRLLSDAAGAPIALTAAELDLLIALAQNAGTVLSRRQLLALTRFGIARPIERSVDVHIARLRSKIEADPKHPLFIKTVRLGGYVFAIPVAFEH